MITAAARSWTPGPDRATGVMSPHAGGTSAIERLFTAIGVLLFVLMLVTPGAFRGLKAVLLTVLLAALVLRISRRRRVALHPAVAVWTMGLAGVGAWLVLRGIGAGAPGAIRMSTVYVFWPLAYLVLLTSISTEARLRLACRILVFAAIAISVWTASYILWSFGYLPDVLYVNLPLRQNHAFSSERIEISMTPLTSLLFLVPFLLAAVLTWPPGFLMRRAWLWGATLPAALLVLVSGRRALLLVVALSVPLTLAARMLLPRATRRALTPALRRRLLGGGVLLLVAVAYLDVVHGLSAGDLWRDFQTGFQFGSDPVASMRAKQADVLLRAWTSAPLLGAGHGAVAIDMVRTHQMPWAYELSYLALLFHAGVLGVAIYAAGAIWAGWTLVRVIGAAGSLGLLLLPVLVGTITFLVGNATNPYLEKWDSLWVVFLPLAFVNAWLLTRSPQGGRTGA